MRKKAGAAQPGIVVTSPNHVLTHALTDDIRLP